MKILIIDLLHYFKSWDSHSQVPRFTQPDIWVPWLRNVILKYEHVFKRQIGIYTCNLILCGVKIKVYVLETEKSTEVI